MLKTAKSIGELIYYYRTIKNYSQSDLADFLDVSVSTVSSWERGINKPSVDIAMKLANDMNITLDDFFKDKKRRFRESYNEITDLITFEKAYLKWKEVNYNRESKSLELGFLVWGLSVQKETLLDFLEINFQTQDGEFIKFESVDVTNQPSPSSHLSPELKMMPILHPPGYLVLYSLTIEKFQDMHVHIDYQGERVVFRFKKQLLEALSDHALAIESDSLWTLEFLKSDIFYKVLKFYAINDRLDLIQRYLETHMHPLKRV